MSFVVDPQPGDRVLDACAAPGGKATHMAELMRNRGEIVAIDINSRGIARLRRMARRLGLAILHPAVADALTWHPDEARFDRVLVDAPCSGLGTLRQHPEIKWKRKPEDIAARANVQRRLLRRASEWVRPGGVLVYATCTITREENDDVLAWFVSRRPSFAIEIRGRRYRQAPVNLIGERPCAADVSASARSRRLLRGSVEGTRIARYRREVVTIAPSILSADFGRLAEEVPPSKRRERMAPSGRDGRALRAQPDHRARDRAMPCARSPASPWTHTS